MSWEKVNLHKYQPYHFETHHSWNFNFWGLLVWIFLEGDPACLSIIITGIPNPLSLYRFDEWWWWTIISHGLLQMLCVALPMNEWWKHTLSLITATCRQCLSYLITLFSSSNYEKKDWLLVPYKADLWGILLVMLFGAILILVPKLMFTSGLQILYPPFRLA